MKYLIVVDVQNDFVDGALGSKEAVAMYPHLLEKVKNFKGTVVMTKDTHPENYLETQEGKLLPVAHCIKDTKGWEFPKSLEEVKNAKEALVYEKPTFGSTKLANDLKNLYDQGQVESVELIGICTDICVISNALLLKATMPELPICVDASCCAGVTPKKHEEALDVMESCQIIVNR
ncbi:Nicotinamidase [Lachnospiraceae bacterium TWA4]|nr:Nicotinamidase [Lachnospiraceae bacterium TWA4]